jgi:hypothetical protein
VIFRVSRNLFRVCRNLYWVLADLLQSGERLRREQTYTHHLLVGEMGVWAAVRDYGDCEVLVRKVLKC